MNNSLPLPVNYTNYTFNTYGVEYYYHYIHPVASIYAALMSLICTIIFAQKELRTGGPFFQYSLVNSAGSLVGMLLLSMMFLTRCGQLCPESSTFWAQEYEIYAFYLVANSLYFSGSIIQISISIQLYFSVTQKLKRLNSVAPVKV